MRPTGLQVVIYGSFLAAGIMSFVICTWIHGLEPRSSAVGAFLPLIVALPFYRKLRE